MSGYRRRFLVFNIRVVLEFPSHFSICLMQNAKSLPPISLQDLDFAIFVYGLKCA